MRIPMLLDDRQVLDETGKVARELGETPPVKQERDLWC